MKKRINDRCENIERKKFALTDVSKENTFERFYHFTSKLHVVAELNPCKFKIAFQITCKDGKMCLNRIIEQG
jgi:hypothetical protein